jgi:ketosteroid isomerase-like protein
MEPWEVGEMVDIEAEKKEIWASNQEWYRLENDKKVDEIFEKFIYDDIIFQVPGMPQFVGREAVYSFMKEFIENVLVSVEGKPTRLEVAESGELAYDLGNSMAKVMGPDGPVDDKQKYLIVWKKIDGKWKAIAGSFSSDLS